MVFKSICSTLAIGNVKQIVMLFQKTFAPSQDLPAMLVKISYGQAKTINTDDDYDNI